MFDPRPLAFGSRSELRNSSDKKWQAKGKKYYKTKMERGSKCENEKDKKKKKKQREQGYQENWVFAVSLSYKMKKRSFTSSANCESVKL